MLESELVISIWRI